MNSVGIFLMYLLGAYLEYNTVVVITAVVSVVTMIAMFKAPESPGVLVKRGEIDVSIADFCHGMCWTVFRKHIKVYKNINKIFIKI